MQLHFLLLIKCNLKRLKLWWEYKVGAGEARKCNQIHFQGHRVTPATDTAGESMGPSPAPHLSRRWPPARPRPSTRQLWGDLSLTPGPSRGRQASLLLQPTPFLLRRTNTRLENPPIIVWTLVPGTRRKIFWTPHLRRRKEPTPPSTRPAISWQITKMLWIQRLTGIYR